MFTRFTIKNFRGFRELSASGLGRVNLVVGKNNVGKTTLLEALFLAAAPNDPAMAGQLNWLRNTSPAPWDVENYWGWLFHGRALDSTIEITLHTDSQTWSKLALSLVEPDGVTLEQIPTSSKLPLPAIIAETLRAQPKRELRFEVSDSQGANHLSQAILSTVSDDIVIVAKGVRPPRTYQTSFQPRLNVVDDRVLDQFSRLRVQKRDGPLLAAVQSLDPRVVRLEVLKHGGRDSLFADINTANLIPVPMMGKGISHIICVLVQLYSMELPGLFCTDGIDEGLHFSAMRDHWKSVGRAAQDRHIQVFATSHSWDCVRAAHEAFAEQADYPLRLIRLQHAGDEIEAVVHDREMIETALEQEREDR